MLESVLYHSTNNRNDNFQGSKIISGSWCSIVLGALEDSGVKLNLLEVLPNTRVLKGCKHSEVMFYNVTRVLTLRTDKSVSANDIVKVFKKKGLI